MGTAERPQRPTARVVLLDRFDRVLLMKGRLPGSRPGSGAWFTVGGGVEPGESLRQAADREIREETGFADFDLGPVVWVRRGVLSIPEPTFFCESYFVARCDGGEPNRGGWDAQERDLIDDIRWWTCAELAITGERVFPPGLSELLPRLLAGPLPSEPIEIPWE